MQSFSLKYKYTFLSFLQAYFQEFSGARWKWDKDVRKTGIIIADSNSVNKGSIKVKPAIILKVGNLSWTNSFRKDGVSGTPSQTLNKVQTEPNYTDLMSASVQLSVLAKTEFEAEELGNHILLLLSGYKSDLQSKGIHKITGLSLSPVQPVKTSAEIELAGCTVSLSFLAQEHFGKRKINYPLTVTVHTTGSLETRDLYEGFDFTVPIEGTGILLNFDLEETESIKASNIDAITLEEKANINLPLSEEFSRLYVVPIDDTIWGYYKILNEIIVNVDTPTVL